MKYKIEYYSGAGNLFSILDNRNINLPKNVLGDFARIACTENSAFSIHTEGFIVVNYLDPKIRNNSFDVLFFNPDGGSGMMCGNGARCAVEFARSNRIINLYENSKPVSFELSGNLYEANIEDGLIRVKFPPQKNSITNLEVPFGDETINGHFADVGTNHIIFDYNSVPYNNNFNFEYYPLVYFAPQIRNNKQIFPNGTNVSIYQIVDKANVKLRTYEKGVEDETGACGTGAVAAAILLFQLGLTEPKIFIIPTSKIPLEATLLLDDIKITGITLKGNAEKIGETFIEF